MTATKLVSRLANGFRWIARIWSTVVFAFAVLQIVYPDAYASAPVPAVDWFLLSLWGVAILGLAAAWRWEAIGATVAIASMFLREIAFLLFKGFWHPAFLLVWAFIIPPALLFLTAWGLERQAKRT